MRKYYVCRVSVETRRANNAALAASNLIKAKTGREASWEWGAFIYELDGHVYHSPLFTSGSHDFIRFGDYMDNPQYLPEGAHVLGLLHSHPDDPFVTGDGRPSDDDWNRVYARLSGESHYGRTYDKNMLLYIYTDETKRTYVYDNTDKRDTRLSCSLEN